MRNPVAELGSGIARWWRRTVWEEPVRRGSPVHVAGRALLRAWGEAIRTFGSDQIEMRAHALTFRTLLSLVPLLAVAFSLFQAFGGLEAGEQTLRRLLSENLAPGSAAAAMQYVRDFVSRISAGAVGGTGVVFLFFTVVSLLSSIEASVNALWGIERGRSFFSRFVVYWTTITVGPVLVALSLSMTSAAHSTFLVGRLDAVVPGASALLFGLVPWVFSCTALTLLYLVVPNTDVRWHAALGGGVVAGTLFELAKLAFTWASANLFRYNAIYGSFGTLPVFLIWLQVAWIVVLLGAKMSFVLQHARALREERLQVDVGPAGREFLALNCMIEVAAAFRRGDPPPSLQHLLPGTQAALKAEQEVLSRLVEAGLLHKVPIAGAGDEPDMEEEGYVPGRDAEHITLDEVVGAFADHGATPTDLETDERASAVAREIHERARSAAAEVTGAMTLAEAVARAAEGDVDRKGGGRARGARTGEE